MRILLIPLMHILIHYMKCGDLWLATSSKDQWCWFQSSLQATIWFARMECCKAKWSASDGGHLFPLFPIWSEPNIFNWISFRALGYFKRRIQHNVDVDQQQEFVQNNWTNWDVFRALLKIYCGILLILFQSLYCVVLLLGRSFLSSSKYM